jgi:hypothetical protein
MHTKYSFCVDMSITLTGWLLDSSDPTSCVLVSLDSNPTMFATHFFVTYCLFGSGFAAVIPVLFPRLLALWTDL